MKIKFIKFLFFVSGLIFTAACSNPAPSEKSSADENVKTVSQDSSVEAKKTENKKSPILPEEVETPEEPIDPVLAKLSPIEAIKDLDKKIEGYQLGGQLTAEQEKQNIELKRKIIGGTFDIYELSRLSLAKHWDEITPAEQKHFVSLMTHLLERKAIFSKEQLRGDNKYYKIEYNSETFEDAEKSKAKVVTRMFVPKKSMDLTLTYRLLKKPQGWKIYDVIVDDASLLSNYKFQFDRIIQKGGFKDLITRMESKLDQIGTQE